MIVSLAQDGWDVIYHRAHALLAAQLAGQWRRTDAPIRLFETIAAISHHDDHVDSIHLSQLHYESNESLTAALKQAPVASLEWTFAKRHNPIKMQSIPFYRASI